MLNHMLLFYKTLLLAAAEQQMKKKLAEKTCGKARTDMESGKVAELLHGHFHFDVLLGSGFDRN